MANGTKQPQNATEENQDVKVPKVGSTQIQQQRKQIAAPDRLTPKQEPMASPEPTEAPIDKFVPGIGIPEVEAADEIKGPSTPERQQETQAIQKQKELTEKVFNKDRIQNLKKQGFSETEAKRWIIAEERRKAERKETAKQREIQETKEQSKLRLAQVEDDLIQLQDDIAFAQNQGLEVSDLMKEQSKLSQEREQLKSALEPVTPATIDDLQEAQAPTVADVKEASRDIRKQQALAVAQNEVALKNERALVERQNQLREEIEREDAALKAIDPNRFWNSKTTGQKILAGLSVMLSGIGAGLTGQENQALKIINKSIDDDIKAQQLNNEQALAKKKQAFELVKMKLDQINAQTDNQLKKAKIAQIYSKVASEQQKIAQERELQKKLSQKEGLRREEVFALDPKLQEKMVRLSDGRFRPALSAQLAKKLNSETIPQAKDSLRGLNRLKEILDMPAAEIRPTLRAEAESIKQAIKGSLRLELFGPGVMTDFESKMADRIIGDPTKIFTLDEIQLARLNSLIKKVRQGTRDKIKQAGVDLPPTRNEKILKQFMSKNPRIKRPEAINALIKLGYWNENEDPGF